MEVWQTYLCTYSNCTYSKPLVKRPEYQIFDNVLKHFKTLTLHHCHQNKDWCHMLLRPKQMMKALLPLMSGTTQQAVSRHSGCCHDETRLWASLYCPSWQSMMIIRQKTPFICSEATPPETICKCYQSVHVLCQWKSHFASQDLPLVKIKRDL